MSAGEMLELLAKADADVVCISVVEPSLCLFDIKPRPFTARDQRHLQEYGREVMVEIAKRAPQSTSADVPIAL
jgi:hypothetical protein